jgi:hypothetical protein
VEAALGGHDVGASGAPGQLERGLVGLGAGVGEEHLPVGSEQLQQLFGEADLRFGGEEVRHVSQRVELAGDRLDERRVGVAERVHGDPAEQVEVTVVVGVPHERALAPGEHELRFPERVHQRVGVTLLHLVGGAGLGVHRSYSSRSPAV